MIHIGYGSFSPKTSSLKLASLYVVLSVLSVALPVGCLLWYTHGGGLYSERLAVVSDLAERDAVEDAKAALARGDRSYLVIGYLTDELVPGMGRYAPREGDSDPKYRRVVGVPVEYFDEGDRPIAEKALRYMKTYNLYIRDH